MGTLGNLQTWVAGLAFLVATVIALWGGIKYGPKGEWGSFFKVVGIAVVIMIIMVMRIKGTTLTERQFGQTMRLHQRDGLGVGRDAFNRVFKKRLEIMAHPEHQLRILKQLRLRWLQRVCVRRPGPLYQKAWLTHPCHHRRYKRMNRLDRCHHLHIRLGKGPAG